MPRLGHAVKSRLPKLLRRVFELGQRFGVNITPNHFYSEIPNIRHLRTTTYWRKPYSMHGVRGDIPIMKMMRFLIARGSLPRLVDRHSESRGPGQRP